MGERKLPLTHDTRSIFALDEALGVDVNALVDAFRSADGDPVKALESLTKARAACDAVEAYVMREARRRRVGTWAELAAPLGITRQALRLRHPDLD